MSGINVFSQDLRGKVRKEVSFLPGAWVVFFDDITAGDISAAQNAKDSQELDTNLALIFNGIAEWNFADEKGNILPVSIDSLKRLPLKFITWLATAQSEVMQNLTEDKKKESSES